MVEVVAGDAPAIATRGQQVEELGAQMVDAASLLQSIGDGSARGIGYAMDKIKSTVGDSHVDPGLAGQRYAPTGTALKAYSAALDAAQTAMRRLVGECEDTERLLQAAHATHADARSAAQSSPDAEPEDTAAQSRNERLQGAADQALAALQRAETAHDENLAEYDGVFDTWWTAYERAVTDIEDATDDEFDDSWSDDLMGVLEIAVEVLKWVGLGIAIAALLLGGPLLAIVALVVGVLALVGTVILMTDGRRGMGDLLMAVLTILPIGKAVKILNGPGRLGRFGSEFVGQFKNPVQQVAQIRRLPRTVPMGTGAAGNTWRGAVANGFRSYVQRVGNQPYFSSPTIRGIGERFVGGTNRTWATTFASNVAGTGPRFQAQLTDNLPGSLQTLLRSGSNPIARSEMIINGAWNTYRWGDRVHSLATTGSP